MPQISIVIPYSGDEQQLESTLVSVLENRPDSCEIIVAHSGDYSDPYDLSDEVRFLTVDRTRRGEILQQVLSETDCQIVHILSPGIQVKAGWTDTVASTFDDPFVGSAAPIIMENDGLIYCAGVENSFLYRNRLLARGQELNQTADLPEPLGPSHHAAFYRTSALRELDCLSELGDSIFGMEVALAMEAIGYESVLLPESIVQVPADMRLDSDLADQLVESQTAVWRFAGSIGFFQGFLLTLCGMLADLIGAPFSEARRTAVWHRMRRPVHLAPAREFREFVDSATGPQPSGSMLPFSQPELSLGGHADSPTKRAA